MIRQRRVGRENGAGNEHDGAAGAAGRRLCVWEGVLCCNTVLYLEQQGQGRRGDGTGWRGEEERKNPARGAAGTGIRLRAGASSFAEASEDGTADRQGAGREDGGANGSAGGRRAAGRNWTGAAFFIARTLRQRHAGRMAQWVNGVKEYLILYERWAGKGRGKNGFGGGKKNPNDRATQARNRATERLEWPGLDQHSESVLKMFLCHCTRPRCPRYSSKISN